MKRIPAFLLVMLTAISCTTPIEYEDTWLDHPDVNDPSLTNPNLRVSTREGLTQADRQRPVVIAVHGFTASTYEWGEFRQYAESTSDVLVSLVLLGAHGRDIDVFQTSTWHDWGRPILAEYEALLEQGYRNITLAGSSTGGTLILEQISRDAYESHPPKHFFFIDPIVVPGNKSLTLIDFLGPLLGNAPNDDMTDEERAHWYTNRPAEALQQLNKLTRRVRTLLADGFRLPASAQAHIYKSSKDSVGDPVSALLIYKGLRDARGDRVDVEMIDSDLHVFTRLQGRDPDDVRERDREIQLRVFSEIVADASGAVATW